MMRRLVALVGCALFSSGCFVILDHEMPQGAAGEFIARRADFAGFLSWPSTVVGESPAEPPHQASVRTVHLNAAPDDDAEAFPVGTIIVKTGAGGEISGEAGAEVHAMVKRGHGFNADGARGWEWFELALDDDGSDEAPLVVWRGENPPQGHSYGCSGTDCAEVPTCNACHAASAANDYVNAPSLTLGSIDSALLGGTP